MRTAILFVLVTTLLNPIVLSQTARQFFERGCELGAKGDHAGAILQYDRAIELKSDFAQAYANRGEAKRTIGKLREALIDFDKVLQLNPDDRVGLYCRGVALATLGDTPGADSDLTKLLRLDPQDGDAHIARGYLRLHSNDLGGASRDFEAAVAADPKAWNAFYGRAQLKLRLRDEKGYAEDMATTIRLKPTVPDPYCEHALNACNFGIYDEAIRNATRAIELDSAYAEAYHVRGIANAGANNRSAAFTDFARAIRLDSTNAVYMANFGRYLIQQHEYDSAMKYLDKALAIDTTFAPAWMSRGVARIESVQAVVGTQLGGRISRAKGCADLKRAVELGLEQARVLLEKYCK